MITHSRAAVSRVKKGSPSPPGLLALSTVQNLYPTKSIKTQSSVVDHEHGDRLEETCLNDLGMVGYTLIKSGITVPNLSERDSRLQYGVHGW